MPLFLATSLKETFFSPQDGTFQVSLHLFFPLVLLVNIATRFFQSQVSVEKYTIFFPLTIIKMLSSLFGKTWKTFSKSLAYSEHYFALELPQRVHPFLKSCSQIELEFIANYNLRKDFPHYQYTKLL